MTPSPPGAAEFERVLASARALHDAGDLDAAEAGYRAALALEQEHPRACNGLGIVMEERGRRAEAAEWFERALRRAPD
ncbi:MAG TPA: tetratricopeptide repeat protein, partial [Candidatus Bathyarchaeia archaeon]|nr:tetratricopeptide repeat protein [Candidatus Bathyarchaeia archaeon]